MVPLMLIKHRIVLIVLFQNDLCVVNCPTEVLRGRNSFKFTTRVRYLANGSLPFAELIQPD